MGVGLFALASALTIATGVMGELVKNRNIILGDQSFHAAEANMREGAHQYVNNLAYTGGAASILNNTNNASIVVTPLDWPYAKAQGTAANDIANRKVSHIITIFQEGLAFDYAVYAQDELNFGGNSTVNGNIFANSGIGFTGNSAEINGDAFSPEAFTDTDNIDGSAVSGVDSIPPPQLDTDDYLNIADNVFADDNDAEAFLNNQTQSALVFIQDTGETKIQGANTELSGFLVTLGDLDITGGTFTALDNYAAIVVAGNLKISGGTTVNGVVYVRGNTTFGAGTNTINGSLISAGDVSVTAITGNATINYDPDLADAFPNLLGLNTISTEEPRIIEWTEE